MPLSSASRALRGPRRRSLLASAAGAALLAGCSSRGKDAGHGQDTDGGPSPTEEARARARRDSQVLVERYDAVIAAHPPLAARLRPLRAEVVRHAKAFADGAGPTPSASSSAVAPAAPPPAVPATERGALADLATAERTLADRRARTLLTVPGELARLLASVAAAGAAHAYLLTESGK